MLKNTEPAGEATGAANATKPPQPRTQLWSKTRSFLSAAAAWLCAAGAFSVMAIALYMFVTPMHASRPPLRVHAALPTQQQWPPPPAPEVEENPVRFVNPFDKGEVFEFPEGTTQEEARAAVAELLTQRAIERQSSLQAQLKRKQ